jgi:hypothetical protein
MPCFASGLAQPIRRKSSNIVMPQRLAWPDTGCKTLNRSRGNFGQLLNPANENDFQPDLTIAKGAMLTESHHNFKR